MQIKKGSDRVVYYLPNIIDVQNQKITVEVSGMTENITYKDNQIVFERPEPGTYDLTFTLSDELGMSSK